MPDRRGIALIVVIIIITIAAIAALGIASAVSNAAMLTTMRVARVKALHAAEAGVYNMVRVYREIGPATPPEDHMYTIRDYTITQPELGMQYTYPDIRYSAYANPDFLCIDASVPVIARFGTIYILRNIFMRNLSRYTSTVRKMKVEWSGMNNIGRGYIWDGVSYGIFFSNGTIVTLNKTLAAGRRNALFGLYFQSDIPATATIEVTFYFSPNDNWMRKFILMRAGYAGNNEFQITSTGKVIKASGELSKRTIKATYDAGTNKITSWQETDTHL